MNPSRKFSLSFVLASAGLLTSGACDVPDDQVIAEDPGTCDVPIPGAELILVRTTGSPTTGSLELPALDSLCLMVESDASSAEVRLGDSLILGHSAFKNAPMARLLEIKDLDNDTHVLSAEISGKPGSVITIRAYYKSGALAHTPAISSADEALLVGQAYIQAYAKEPMFTDWQGAKAVRATPLTTSDGLLEAFELDVENANGEEAGYLVLEASEMRPLLGSAATEGLSLTEGLVAQYEADYGTSPFEANGHVFLWAGTALMALEVVTDNDTRVVQTCADCGATFMSEDRPVVGLEELGLSTEQWIAARKDSLDDLLEGLGTPLLPSEAVVPEIGGLQMPNSQAPEQTFTCIDDEDEYCDIDVDDKKLTAIIPGGANSFSYFYQQNDSWPDAKKGKNDDCFVGCTPVAAVTLLEYWDRRGYGYLITDKYGATNSLIADGDVKDALTNLRTKLGTYCKDDDKDQGSTPLAEIDTKLVDYINFAAGQYSNMDPEGSIPMGWVLDHKKCPNSAYALKAILHEIQHRRPVISHYYAGYLCPASDAPASHSAVTYGVYDDGKDGLYDDLIAVRTGWKDTPYRLEPIYGTGTNWVTSIKPGCEPSSAPFCKTFSDLSDYPWAHNSVETLSCMCVVQGQPDGTFGAGAYVTKAEFLKMVVRLAYSAQQVANLDDETPGKHWASKYITFADGKGLLAQLKTNGVFNRDAPINRQEAAYLVVMAGMSSNQPHFKALATSYGCLSGMEAGPYSDSISQSFRRYVLAATDQCVFQGYVDGEFKPANYISRVEAAKVACMARFGYASEECQQSQNPPACVPLIAQCP